MKRTPYCGILKEMGGKFVDFAGYDMPVQFEGILAEHKAVRENVGLFDVSHMGEVLIEGEGALATLQKVFTNNYETLKAGRVRYSLMLNENGGVVDDVLVYCIKENETYLVCVNASNADKDFAWISSHLEKNTTAKNLSDDTAQLAVQGPSAINVIGKIFKENDIPDKYYSFKIVDGVFSKKVIVSRTGYTAEDGFEIYCDVSDAKSLFDKVIAAGKDVGLKLCGLGARDTLRLEGAMPLYGHEMNENTLATEIGLDAYIKFDKPSFIGKDALLEQKRAKRRIGIELVDRGIAREHAEVYSGNLKIGEITSGTMSPTLGKSIAMARVDANADLNNLFVDVRGKKLRAEKVELPFYKRNK